MGKIIIGCWDCAYCNTTRISGDLRECPNCGRPRDKDVRFYMADPENYAKDQENVNKNPDWLCPYCNSLNPDSASVCSSCGAQRDASSENYFENQKTQAKLKEQEKAAYAPEPEHTAASAAPRAGGGKTKFIILAVIAALIALVVFLVLPKSKDLEIASCNWERSIEVQEYKEFEESAWNLPDDAYDVTKRRELYGYDSVFDHYETRTRQVPEQVLDHYETEYSYKDLGNGRFEQIENQRPVYTTQYRTETYQEPVYVQVPVYETKYYYYIMRWVTDHYETTSGQDDEPYFAEIQTDDTHRTGAKTEEYWVVDTKGEKYRTSYEIWKSLKAGQKVNASIQYGEILEIK